MKTMTLCRPNAIEGFLGRPGALGDFDRYFESFFDDSLLAPAARVFARLPAVDVRETESAYLLDMELPGYSEKDIEIHVDGSSLSVATKQENANEKKGDAQETWILKERRVSSFSRSFKLPENANPEEVSAEFKNGVLSMEVKKRAEARKRAVEIKV